MGWFSSVTSLKSREGYASNSSGVEAPSSGTSVLGSIATGAALAGVGAAAFFYKNNPAARLSLAKRLTTALKIDATQGVRSNRGVFQETLVGAASDLAVLAHNINKIPATRAEEALRSLQAATKPRFEAPHATVHDLLSQYQGVNQDAADALHKHLITLASRIDRPGVTAESIAKETYLGENILHEAGGIGDYRRYTLEGMAQRGLQWSHENLKFPVVGFAPTDLFLHHAWAHTSQVGVMGPRATVRGQRLEQQALQVGRKIFTEGGQVIEGNWKKFSTSSTLAESAAIVSGQHDVRPLYSLLEDGEHGPLHKWFMGKQHQAKLASMPDAQRESYLSRIEELQASRERADFDVRAFAEDVKSLEKDFGGLGDFWENFIISPKWRRTGSMIGDVADQFERIHSGVASQTKDAAGKFLRDLDKDPLSLIEEARLRLKGDVRGFEYKLASGAVSPTSEGVEAVTLGSGTSGPRKIGGFQDFVPGVHNEDAIVRGFDDYATRPKVANQFIVAEGGDNVLSNLFTSDAGKAFWHFQAKRPSKLFEALTGFGVRPDPSVMKTFLMGSLGTYAAFEIVKNSMLYFNFLTLGLPAKALGVAVGGMQVGGQAALTATGIAPASDFLEDHFPGSINSLGSQLLRVFAAPFVGAYLGGKFLKGMKVPGAIASMIPTSVRDGMLSGSAIGAMAATSLAVTSVLLDPTKGVSEQYDEATGKKKVAVRNARWWIAGRTPYGGDYIKYYDQSFAQKLWHSQSADYSTYGSPGAKWGHSWFPTPSNLFGLRPLVNPYYVDNLNQEARPYPTIDPVGGNLPIIGPAFQATVGQIIKPRITYDVNNAGTRRGHYGEFDTNEAYRLGMDVPISEVDARSPGGPSSIAHHTISKMQDFLGVYGFATKFVTNPVLGSDTGFGGGEELEGSSRMTHQGEQLREMNLGGFLGETEYLRRLYNDRSRSVNYYNPLPNTSPDWLPGSGSQFREDRTARLDFHTGDPMGKVEHGDVRLPGPGYEATYGYHGGKAPDIIDAWAILSDVAPGSHARKTYEKMVDMMYAQGQMDASGAQIYERVKSESAERLGGRYSFKDYANHVEQTPGPASMDSKRYLSYINSNIAETPTNPLLAPFEGAWNTVTHTRIPGLAWAQGKFMHNRTPLEEYQASQVHGTDFSDWSNPWAGFIRPAHTEMMGAVLGHHYRPWEVQKKDEIDEYYDKLKYLKARRLQKVAKEAGASDLSHEYGSQQKQTVVGMDYGLASLNRNLFSALPPNMRSFVGGFANATPAEANRIEGYLPSYQKELWRNIWTGNQQGIDQVQNKSPIEADQEVAEYFSRHALPGPESNLWNPDVSLDEYRLKSAEHAKVNYWTMGIPEAQAREYRSLGRADVLIDTSPFAQDMSVRNKILTEMGHQNVDGSVNMSNVRQTQTVKYNSRRHDEAMSDSYTGRF